MKKCGEKSREPSGLLPERIFRMRLCEMIFREVVSREAGQRRGDLGDGGDVDESLGRQDAGGPGGSSGSVRSPGRVVVDDMLLLKDQLPMPESEEAAWGMGDVVQAVLDRCESELVRSIPVGNLVHYVAMAARASKLPYVPTLDELFLY